LVKIEGGAYVILEPGDFPNGVVRNIELLKGGKVLETHNLGQPI